MTRLLNIYCEAIQLLRNTDGDRGGSTFPERSVTKVYGSMLLALRGGGCLVGVQIPGKKRYVTL